MKILIVNDQYESGGAARVASTMCNGFLKRGYEVHTVSSVSRNSIRYTLDDKIELHDVDFSTHGKGNLARLVSLFRTAKDIRKEIKKIKPDVIIAIQANGFIRASVGSLGLHIPIIAADHTSFARKMDLINTFTRHYLYKYADGLSILTKRDENLLGDKYPQKRVIYNPLTYPLLTESTARNKTVLCAGRFDIWKIKGFDLIIDIWAELSSKYPDWKLVFAGTGKEENVDYIKGLVNERKLNNSVQFLGQVDDMKTLYAHSGIFALPSRVEGFPMVLLEAMSQGCPCVAFNVGGASEEMIGGGAGYVIKDGDIEAFKNALSNLMNDDDKRKQCSIDAIQSVSTFTVEKFIDQWELMIKDTLEKNKR